MLVKQQPQVVVVVVVAAAARAAAVVIMPLHILDRIAVLRRCGLLLQTESICQSVTVVIPAKWLNLLRCHLGCGLGGPKEMY